MAYAQPFIRLNFQYTITAMDETAQFGVDFAPETEQTAAYCQGILESISAADFQTMLSGLATFHANGSLKWASYSNLIGVKGAVIKEDGHYQGEPVAVLKTAASTGDNNEVVPSNTVCITLWDGASFGGGHLGRFYLPHSKLSQEAGTPRALASGAASVATAARTFLTGCQNLVSATDGTVSWNLVVASQEATLTVLNPVEFVRCGRVTDTQRRRRKSIDEDYQQVAYPS